MLPLDHLSVVSRVQNRLVVDIDSRKVEHLDHAVGRLIEEQILVGLVAIARVLRMLELVMLLHCLRVNDLDQFEQVELLFVVLAFREHSLLDELGLMLLEVSVHPTFVVVLRLDALQ